MGYWVAGQVRTMRSSVIYKSIFRIGEMIFRSALMIPCEVLLRSHLRNTNSISMIISGLSATLYWAYLFPWECILNWNRKDCTSLWSLTERGPSLKYLMRVKLLFLSSSIGGLLLPELLDEVLVLFPWSSWSWRTHWPLTARCFLQQQYYFPSLVFFPLTLLDLTESKVGDLWWRQALP